MGKVLLIIALLLADSQKRICPLSYRFWPEQVSQSTQAVRYECVYHIITRSAPRQRGKLCSIESILEEGLSGSASNLGLSTVNQPGGSEYRVKVFTGASATDCRDLLLWQFPGYGSRIAWGIIRRLANRKKRWRGKQEAGRETVVRKAWSQIFIENVRIRYIIELQIT